MARNYQLPEVSIPESEGKRFVKDEVKTWTTEDLERWLTSFELAEWVEPWIRQLQARWENKTPEFLFKGLGKQETIPRWMKHSQPRPAWLFSFLEDSDVSKTWFDKGFLQDDPAWLNKLIEYEQAKVARSFLLTDNIADYVFDPEEGYCPTLHLLIKRLLQTKECVLVYRLANGLSLHVSQPEEEQSIKQQLPSSLQTELEHSGYTAQDTLLATACRLFDAIREWLGGESDDPNSDGWQSQSNSAGTLGANGGVAIIFENIHLLIPANRDDLEYQFLIDNLLYWSHSPKLFGKSHCLILMAEALEDVNRELRSRGGKIEQITVPRPASLKTRLKFLLPMLSKKSMGMKETRISKQGSISLEGYDGSYIDQLESLSRDTAGLTFFGIEDLLQEVAATDTRSLDRKKVMKIKRESLRTESDGLVEVIDPGKTLDDIGGYEYLKERLREVVAALKASNDPLLQLTIPMGILFLGPPGTGKSIVAEALAGESDISMVKLGDFRGMYVGQSERNLSRIFSLLESLHPVIVFIDEIDQALGKRSESSGDGGVDNRIFGRFLEFMSNKDHRGNILWVGASNFPNKIDAAMKRAGRFDLILPFLLPDTESRKLILEVLINKELKGLSNIDKKMKEQDYTYIAERTDGFSGAELHQIISEAFRRLARRRISQNTLSSCLDVNLFKEILIDYRPPDGQREEYIEMEELAVENVSFLNLLPDKYRNHDEKTIA